MASSMRMRDQLLPLKQHLLGQLGSAARLSPLCMLMRGNSWSDAHMVHAQSMSFSCAVLPEAARLARRSCRLHTWSQLGSFCWPPLQHKGLP